MACHETHSNNTKNSCKTCHPAISNCKIDVTKMNTSYADAKSPNNIHFVGCTDCHKAEKLKKLINNKKTASLVNKNKVMEFIQHQKKQHFRDMKTISSPGRGLQFLLSTFIRTKHFYQNSMNGFNLKKWALIIFNAV